MARAELLKNSPPIDFAERYRHVLSRPSARPSALIADNAQQRALDHLRQVGLAFSPLIWIALPFIVK